MLRVVASRNAKEYFKESLSKEDYYTEGQEIRGEWQGVGAREVGTGGIGEPSRRISMPCVRIGSQGRMNG